MCMYVYIYIYTHIHTYMHTHYYDRIHFDRICMTYHDAL